MSPKDLPKDQPGFSAPTRRRGDALLPLANPEHLKRIFVECGFQKRAVAVVVGLSEERLSELVDGRLGVLTPATAAKLEVWSRLWIEALNDLLGQWGGESWEDFWFEAALDPGDVRLPATERFGPPAPDTIASDVTTRAWRPVAEGSERMELHVRSTLLTRVMDGLVDGVRPEIGETIVAAWHSARTNRVFSKARALYVKKALDSEAHPTYHHRFMEANGVGEKGSIRDDRLGGGGAVNIHGPMITVFASLRQIEKSVQEAQGRAGAGTCLGTGAAGSGLVIDAEVAGDGGSSGLELPDLGRQDAKDAGGPGRAAVAAVSAEPAPDAEAVADGPQFPVV